MIRLVSLAPSLDLEVHLRKLPTGKIGILEECRVIPGGKAVNLARFLKAWGVPSRLSQGAGGGGHPTHVLYESLLRGEGLRAEALDPEAPIRTNLVMTGRGPAEKYNHPGFALSRDSLARFERTFSSFPPGDFFVLTGRCPKGFPASRAAGWVRRLEKRGVHCWVDTSDEPLRALLGAGPSFLKVNLFELGEALGREFKNLEQLIPLLPTLHRRGLRHGAITQGAEGVLAWEGPEVVRARPPKVSRLQPLVVGAGDGFLAGYLHAWRGKKNLAERVRWALASGTTVAAKGIMGFDPKLVARLAAQVKVN